MEYKFQLPGAPKLSYCVDTLYTALTQRAALNGAGGYFAVRARRTAMANAETGWKVVGANESDLSTLYRYSALNCVSHLVNNPEKATGRWEGSGLPLAIGAQGETAIFVYCGQGTPEAEALLYVVNVAVEVIPAAEARARARKRAVEVLVANGNPLVDLLVAL